MMMVFFICKNYLERCTIKTEYLKFVMIIVLMIVYSYYVTLMIIYSYYITFMIIYSVYYYRSYFKNEYFP